MILSKCNRLSSSGAKYYGNINKNGCRGLRTGSEKGQQASGRFIFRGFMAGCLVFTLGTDNAGSRGKERGREGGNKERNVVE